MTENVKVVLPVKCSTLSVMWKYLVKIGLFCLLTLTSYGVIGLSIVTISTSDIIKIFLGIIMIVLFIILEIAFIFITALEVFDLFIDIDCIHAW